MTEQSEQRLSNIEKKLDLMYSAISKIAVQKERLDKIEQRNNALWGKWDKLVDPDIGMLPVLKSKVLNSEDRIDNMKWVVGVLGATSISCTLSIFAMAYYIWRMTGVTG